MSYNPQNPNGQGTMANSEPVVIASDQSSVPINDAGGSVTVDATSLPLPTGASTSAKQDTANTSLASIDAKLTNPLPVSGTVATGGLTDTQLRAAPVPVSGTVTSNAGTNLNTSLLALETGGNLAAIKTDVDKIPSQGQALAAASMPVVLPVAQITTLTPPAAITGFNLESTQLLVKAKTDNLDVALSTRLKPADTLAGITTVAAVTAITNALPAGTNLLGKVGIDQTTPGTTNKVSIGTDGTVAINAALPAGTNVIGHVINDTGSTTAVTGNVAVTNAGLSNIDVALSTRTKPSDQQHAIIDSGTISLPSNAAQETGGNLEAILNDLDNISATTDLLASAFERSENAPLYVEDISNKKDINKAFIPSDAPAPLIGSGNAVNSVPLLIDTTGYQSISVQTFGTFSATVTFTVSNDGVNWVAILGYSTAGAAFGSGSLSSTGFIMIFPCVGKYFRAQVTSYTSGNVQVIAYLRQQGFPNSLLFSPSINLQSIVSNTAVTAGISGLLAVGGNIAPAAARTSNPIPISGTDSGNLTRVLRTDTTGNIGISATDQAGTNRPLTTLNTAGNQQSVPIINVEQFEGQSLLEIMAQILVELRINNLYMSELPTVLNLPNGKFEEPDSLRKDVTLLTAI